ncbi:hypothetical protein ACQY0O_000476 [Thecaphora frezii]
MALVTVILFDLLLLVVLARLLSNFFLWSLHRILERFYPAAQSRLAPRLQLISSTQQSSRGTFLSAHSVLHARITAPGGVGGTTIEDSDHEAETPELVFPHAPLLSQRVQQRWLALERRSSSSNAIPAPRRHWVALTDPTLKLEVAVYPQIIGIAKAFLLELASTRAVSWMLEKAAPALGVCNGAHIHLSAEPDLSPFSRLPQELITEIILLSASPSLSLGEPPASPVNVLLLCKQYYRLLLPKLYHTVCLHTPYAFRNFRLALALHNPSLGKLVRRLQIGSSQFDISGYIPGQLAEQGPLATGIEQMLLATPGLEELSIDLFCLAALHTGTASRLEKGCQPKRVTTELSAVPYLSLPTFEDVEELELLVFGLDAQTAINLRTSLPRLARLTIRYVSRRRPGKSDRDSRTPRQERPEASYLGEDEFSDTFATSSDVHEFIEAVQLMRTWPDGDATSGEMLQRLTVFTWPSALGALTTQIPDARPVHSIEHDVNPTNSAQEADAAIVPSPLFVGIDTSYLLGPRRGAHVLWRKDRTRLAWS